MEEDTNALQESVAQIAVQHELVLKTISESRAILIAYECDARTLLRHQERLAKELHETSIACQADTIKLQGILHKTAAITEKVVHLRLFLTISGYARTRRCTSHAADCENGIFHSCAALQRKLCTSLRAT